MKRFIKDYFTFSRKELNGLLVLITFIILAFILPKIINKNRSITVFDVSEFEKEIASFEYQIKKEKPIEIKNELFTFNPNTVLKSDLTKLGLSQRQANTLINYRNSGGYFNKKKDLKKVYGISNKLYKELEPYVIIEETKKDSAELNAGDKFISETKYNLPKDATEREKTNHVEVVKIEINSADSIQLLQLPRIGASYSRRIINYRNFLGGFHNINQLKEVFGISENTIDKIKDMVEIDTSYLQMIDLNSADFKTINKHPYLNYKQTKLLLKYRDLMNHFENHESILENKLLDSVTYFKVKPYLSVKSKNSLN